MDASRRSISSDSRSSADTACRSWADVTASASSIPHGLGVAHVEEGGRLLAARAGHERALVQAAGHVAVVSAWMVT